MHSSEEKKPKSSGPLFSGSAKGSLRFDLMPVDLIKMVFSFLDEESQRRFAMIKLSEKNELYNQLMQAALVNHFLQVVAEGHPPQYELSRRIKPPLKPGTFYVDLPEEKEAKEINYTVLTSDGKTVSGVITSYDLENLNVKFPKSLTLDTLKTILPDILEITAVREHTYAMGAEKLLATHPELKKLVSQRGNVTDYAGYHFTNITAFQYAVWAKDRHMWFMLQKNMTPEEVQKQLAEMKEDKFKSQHGSHWDCPKEYDLNYHVLDTVPSLIDLKNNKQSIPALIKILGKEESKFYIYGYDDDGRTPQLVELDKTKIRGDVVELEQALKEEKSSSIHVTNTKKYSALHAEIDEKGGHFINPLGVALQEFVDTLQGYEETIQPNDATAWAEADDHLDEIWFKVGEAQRKVPVHIPNEYCRHDRSFDPTPEFKETVLPRTCNLWNNTVWFPLRDNEGSCLIHLLEKAEAPTLEKLKESKCKIPTLIKKANEQGVPEFYLYALHQGTRSPALSPLTDVSNALKQIRFMNSKSHWVSAGDGAFAPCSASGLVFSSLGFNFGFYRAGAGGWPGGDTRPRAGGWWSWRLASLDLLAVAGLCHERTLEVTQLKQPALMAEHKLTQ